MMAVSSGSPSPFGSFHMVPSQIKKPLLPQWEQGQKINSAVPPCLPGRPDRSFRCQHIGCPITQATRQKILRRNPFPLPSAAHLLPRFSLRSQLCETLCGCACNFTSASKVYSYQFVLLNYISVRLSSTFFRPMWMALPRYILYDSI